MGLHPEEFFNSTFPQSISHKFITHYCLSAKWLQKQKYFKSELNFISGGKNMRYGVTKVVVGGIVCLFILAGLGGGVNGNNIGDAHHALLEKGIAYYHNIRAKHGIDESQQMLKMWFLKQPSVKKVSLENRDMTVEFNDGHKVVILGHTENQATWGKPSGTPGKGHGHGGGGGGTNVTQTPDPKKALILDPFDWEGGVFHNPDLMNNVEGYLQSAGYTCTYLKNSQVTLSVIENDLAQYGVIYNRGHGGTSGRTVIISTGEEWTDTTTQTYSDEYNNGEIVEVAISASDGYHYFIAYTPKLIQHHYNNLPNSLVYMESCESMKFSNMGDAYVGAGAGAYMGWDKSVTVTYGDSTADTSFQMFSTGSSVDDVANAFGPDPSTHANLKYVGAGDLGLVMPS